MPEFPDIPPLTYPPTWSILAFSLVVIYVAICFVAASFSVSKELETSHQQPSKNRFASNAIIGLAVWLVIGAILPLSGLLRLNILPPPGLIYAFACFGVGIVLACSNFGKRLATLPYYWLIGFQAFRFPLELLLHYWYRTETIPIQMTFAGYNFDIVAGLLGITIGLWAKFGSPPRTLLWAFNLIGIALLLTVVAIAITSVPTPFKQFDGDPLLLPLYFPFNYIVSIAVTGALLAHLILFRKLINESRSNDGEA